MIYRFTIMNDRNGNEDTSTIGNPFILRLREYPLEQQAHNHHCQLGHLISDGERSPRKLLVSV